MGSDLWSLTDDGKASRIAKDTGSFAAMESQPGKGDCPYIDHPDKYVREGIDNPAHDNESQLRLFLTHGWFGKAGSVLDAWLTSSAGQIGQIMLSLPRAVYLTGAAAGLSLMVVIGLIGAYTIFLLNSLYIEFKRHQLAAGTWYAPGTRSRKQASQYYEVIGALTHRWIGYVVLVVTAIGLTSTGIAQIIACSADTYYIDDTVSKRTWALAWGAVLSSVFSLVPTFKHLKILALVGIAGTFYTSVYICITAGLHVRSNGWNSWTSGPTTMKGFFLGFNICMNALGGHGMSFEVMDTMWKPSKYANKVYPFATIFTYLVTVPHSVIVVLAYGVLNLTNDNVYGVLAANGWRTASIVLMLLHQCVAYVIYIGPVFFMSEKLFGVHSGAYWKRVLARVPVAALVWFVGLLIPYYGIVNSLMGAITGSLTGFVIPTAVHLWVFRKASIRNDTLKQPFKVLGDLGWPSIMLLNVIILVIFTIFGLGFGMWSAMANLVAKIGSLGVFTECYQCAPK